MAGPRANLAVTKDGETYNKLQRPDNFFDAPAISMKADERKRELASVDNPTAEMSTGRKRVKANHMGSAVNDPLRSGDHHTHRSNAPIADCGMRFTLPIDEDEAQYSDDSLGEALAYLRSVRSEASTIPHLLVASTVRNIDTRASHQNPSTTTSEHAFYHDGAWISVNKRNATVYDEYQKSDDIDPQSLYHNHLIKLFETLRSVLEQETRERTQPKHEPGPTTAVRPPSNRHEWLYTIDREYPTPALICQLDERNVKRGLEYCAYALDRFDTISRQKSCWIWTLLAMSGDVGTLDSQNMSHIRDIATKAAGMSKISHESSERPDRNPTAADKVIDAQGHSVGSKVGKPESCGTNKELHNQDTECMQSEADEAINLIPAISPSQAVLGSQIDAQTKSNVLTKTHEETNDDTNDNALEEARARLLAQLGDNLIQAGIPAPTPTPSTDEAHARHKAQLAKTSAPLQDENKVHTMLSRAEAERQRQALRMRDSGSRQAGRPCTESSKIVLSAPDASYSCALDLNTRVTIDMILTVVAEFYGQRDLLEFRRPW